LPGSTDSRSRSCATGSAPSTPSTTAPYRAGGHAADPGSPDRPPTSTPHARSRSTGAVTDYRMFPDRARPVTALASACQPEIPAHRPPGLFMAACSARSERESRCTAILRPSRATPPERGLTTESQRGKFLACGPLPALSPVPNPGLGGPPTIPPEPADMRADDGAFGRADRNSYSICLGCALTAPPGFSGCVAD
jgi:hypothetical protein